MMKRTIVAAALLAGAAITAQAAEIVLFERAGFDGRAVTLRGYMQDLATLGFDGHASSAAVRSGTWEVCTEPDFRGFCAVMQPGGYRRLDSRFNNRIASAREVEATAGVVAPIPAPLAAERGSIELFGQRGFRGRAITLDRDAGSLDAYDFNDRASSVVVREGRWELCTDAVFRGTCRVFEPGQYAELGALANNISSARMLHARPDERATVVVPAVPAPVVVAPQPAPPRIVLFDRDEFRGRSLTVTDDLGDLGRSNFNNDPASIVVESGTWEVCSDAFYRGRCQILPPGEYRRLDAAMYRSISSVRPAGVEYGGRERPAVAAVELFEGINFDGRRTGIERDMPSLDARNFNDRASSMIIHEGQWEVCRDAGYNGRCNVFGPGRYADLGRMNNEISSMRRLR